MIIRPLTIMAPRVVPPVPPGPTFDTVTIGNQIWMSKNLAIDDGQSGIRTRTVNYGQGDVVEYYYNWDAAVRVAASITGWHLPTRAEWNTLANAVGGTSTAGTKLKSTYGWNNDGNGTDDYGFAAFPAGDPDLRIGNYANFWTTSELSSPDYAEYIKFRYNTTSMGFTNFRKSNQITIRLVKDAT